MHKWAQYLDSRPQLHQARIREFLRRSADPRQPWQSRPDGATLAVLAVLSIAVRWPLRAEFLTTWDSILFALAMESYDVAAARPHPPGYPVYVALGRIASSFTTDANTALVLVSIILSTAAVVLLYGFIRRLGSRRAATVAALLFSLSPVLMYNSVIATSYPADAFFAVAIAWAAWEQWRNPSIGRAALLAALFALCLGVRQSLLFFLTPVVVYAMFFSAAQWREKGKQVGAAAAVGTAVVAAWAIPMIVLSGGLESYLMATSLQSSQVVFAFTVYQHGMLAWNDLWPRFAFYTRAERTILLPTLAVIIATALLLAWRKGHPLRPTLSLPAGGALLLAVWAIPSLLFYLTVFNGWDRGPIGYALVFLPAVYGVFGLMADACTRFIEGHTGRFQTLAAAALTILMVAPAVGLVGGWDDASDHPYKVHDQWASNWMGLNEAYDPQTTAIVAHWNWAHAMWYFPEYRVWSYIPLHQGPGGPAWVLGMEASDHQSDLDWYRAIHAGPDGTRHPVDGIERVIVFDFQLAGENNGTRRLHADVQVHEDWLPNGWRILYFETAPERPYIQDYFEVPSNVATY